MRALISRLIQLKDGMVSRCAPLYNEINICMKKGNQVEYTYIFVAMLILTHAYTKKGQNTYQTENEPKILYDCERRNGEGNLRTNNSVSSKKIKPKKDKHTHDFEC